MTWPINLTHEEQICTLVAKSSLMVKLEGRAQYMVHVAYA